MKKIIDITCCKFCFARMGIFGVNFKKFENWFEAKEL